MKKILCLVPLLFCLGITSAFAGNDVTVRICVTGNSSFSDKSISGYFSSERAFSRNINLNPISLGSSSRNCVEEVHHYNQKYTNKIYFNVVNDDKIYEDESCKSGYFSEHVYGDYFGFICVNTIKIDNSYEKTPINWGIEYDIDAKFGKPIKASCKLFF